MKRKILYNHPVDGSQRLDYAMDVSSDCDVIWDEKKDGPFPADKEDKVGWLKRSGKNLVQDSSKKADRDAKRQAKKDERLAKKDLKARLLAGTATNDEMQALLARLM